MIDMERLGKLLPKEQPPERIHRMWQVVEAGYRRQPRPARRGPLLIALAGATMTAAIVGVLLWPRLAPGALTLQEGAPVPEELSVVRATKRFFSDGSTLRLTAGAEISLIANSAKTVRFEVRKGAARFDIVPNGPRAWHVDCGPISIAVLGTVFFIDRNDSRVSVTVERGVVRVRGDGVDGERSLVAGESLTVPARPPSPVTSVEKAPVISTSTPAPEGASDAVPEQPPVPTPPLSRSKRKPPSWQIHAEAGDYREAFAQLGSEGVASLTKRSKDVDELFELADVARLSGHPKDALAPLETIVRDFSTSPRAGLAAYTLGRLYLEQLAAPHKAVGAFDKAIQLGIPEALDEAAVVKQIRALMMSGDPRGKKLASEYLMNYSVGQYRRQVERWYQGDTTDIQ